MLTAFNYTNSVFVFQKDLIVMNEIIGVMAVDALATSHPLSSKEEDIMKPEHISELFDSITYSKVEYNRGCNTTTTLSQCVAVCKPHKARLWL